MIIYKRILKNFRAYLSIHLVHTSTCMYMQIETFLEHVWLVFNEYRSVLINDYLQHYPHTQSIIATYKTMYMGDGSS